MLKITREDVEMIGIITERLREGFVTKSIFKDPEAHTSDKLSDTFSLLLPGWETAIKMLSNLIETRESFFTDKPSCLKNLLNEAEAFLSLLKGVSVLSRENIERVCIMEISDIIEETLGDSNVVAAEILLMLKEQHGFLLVQKI